jgi:hypothetical protein
MQIGLLVVVLVACYTCSVKAGCEFVGKWYAPWWGPSLTGYLEIPSDWTSIPKEAFTSCAVDVDELKMHNKIRSIGDRAFQNQDIETVNIPNSVTYIGTGAFQNNREMKAINLGSSVTSEISHLDTAN